MNLRILPLDRRKRRQRVSRGGDFAFACCLRGGRTALPFLGAYAASKFALEGLTESLRREMILFGVDVIAIAPGMVATEMTVKGAETDIAPYKDTPYAAALEKLRSFMTPDARATPGSPATRSIVVSGMKPPKISEAPFCITTRSSPISLMPSRMPS